MKLKQPEFKKIQKKIYEYCGINLHEGKQSLVRARVMKRIRKLGLRNFTHYMQYLEEDTSGKEFLALVDVLTTNKTSFFRERQHFDFIKEEIIPKLNGKKVKWWSAGCSTGEEPVTCSIILHEQNIADNAVKILGTDISRKVIRTAKKGIYLPKNLADVQPNIKNKYFEKVSGNKYKVKKIVSNRITYGRLNLKKGWPLAGPFHLIMCRNVMIYFNRKTQRELVSRFQKILEPGGYLFLGHSESVASTEKKLQNIRPAIYQKR